MRNPGILQAAEMSGYLLRRSKVSMPVTADGIDDRNADIRGADIPMRLKIIIALFVVDMELRVADTPGALASIIVRMAGQPFHEWRAASGQSLQIGFEIDPEAAHPDPSFLDQVVHVVPNSPQRLKKLLLVGYLEGDDAGLHLFGFRIEALKLNSRNDGQLLPGIRMATQQVHKIDQ